MEEFDFSFVMATIGRSRDIACFIESLLNQSETCSWELIIVDQNSDDRVLETLSEFDNIPPNCSIFHIRIEEIGLSNARNIGLKQVSGRIIGFPDDDCVYGKDTLSFVKNFFYGNFGRDAQVLSLQSTDDIEFTKSEMHLPIFFKIRTLNIFERAISYTIFVRGFLREREFDVNFGVGARYGAAEETDYLFSLLIDDYKLYWSPSSQIYHPKKTNDIRDISRIYSYNFGIGAFFRKNISINSWKLFVLFLMLCFKTSMRIIQYTVIFKPNEIRWHFTILQRRLSGFFLYKRE